MKVIIFSDLLRNNLFLRSQAGAWERVLELRKALNKKSRR
jgi:hypothetical protein